MSNYFTGEVQLFAFNFAPYSFALANGALTAISQNAALYALYGTTFGGDGQNTFGLPNLASQQACGAGQSQGNSMRTLGQLFGTAGVTLDQTQIPAHNHIATSRIAADPTTLTATPATGGAIGSSAFGTFDAFGAGSPAAMAGGAVAASGGNSAHENRQPFLALNYSVCLNGVYPTFP